MTPPSGYVETLIARLLESSSFKPQLEGSREDRLSYLANACAQDEVLRARLYDLLTSLAGARPVFPASPPPAAAVINMLESALAQESREHDESVDSWIGPYHLLQKIGEGGFGTVWMAEQMEPVRRMVALKIIKRGMDTREVISRFEAERQALAMMDHPNIARVFDAGSTDNGRPYFVMELVRGLAITRYCDEVRLPAEARLRLFTAVCNGVQHAHQKGIIHRDLKPSNILVTLHDGTPVPKIIDFGIAKAMGTSLTERTLFTQFHAFIGTPAYTSPEQMELSGLDVDTRSDIYSLGVLLYELLTGRPPFDPNALAKSGLDAMRRTICELDPPRPSQRLNTLSQEDRSTVAQERSTEVGKLSLLLRGDLDWVVMRCLEKDRTRRYETVNALARDVQRHLASEPIWARPPSNLYRLRKFIRRHRVGVVASVAVALSIVIGLIIALTLLVRTVRAERAEAKLRQAAEVARELETKRASHTAISLANQLLEKGQTAEALAYLVHAARKDPANVTLGPRLASVLTSHTFLIPQGVPFQCRSRVLTMRYTRDGRSIYVGTEDGAFRIFNAASGTLTREFHLGKNVQRGGWSFARDNEAVFAIRFIDDTIAVVDVASGRPHWPAIAPEFGLGTDAGLGGRVAIQLSPDGRWLAAHGTYDFWLLDVATGESRMKLHFPDWHFGPDFTSDGRRMVLVNGDVVRTWSLPDGKPDLSPISITGRNAPGLYLLPFFSADGRKLALCDPFAGIHIFDAATGEKLRFLPRPSAFDPSSAGFLPDGKLFFATGRSAELLDLETAEAITLPVIFGFAAQSVRIGTPDGQRLLTATNDGYIRLWNIPTGQLAIESTIHQSEPFCVALAPDGQQVLLGTAAGELYSLSVGRRAAQPLVLPQPPPLPWHPFLRDSPARVLSFQRDRASAIEVASGREVAGGFAYPKNDAAPLLERPNLGIDARKDFKYLLVRDNSGATASRIWEITSEVDSRGIPLEGDTGSPPGGIGVAFSPTGDLVARQKREHVIGVWDLHTGTAVGPGCSLPGRELCAYPGIEFSPDGKHLAGGVFATGEVVIWEVATGRVLTRIDTHAHASVERLHFSPDGTRLLTFAERHEAQLWDPHTGEPRSSVIRSTDSFDADFSPDGRWFAIWGDHSVSVWDGHSGTPVSTLEATGSGGVKFSPDGGRLAAFDRNRVARVWDVKTGQALSEPMRNSATDMGIEGFSPDGRFVQTGSDGACTLWSVPPSLEPGTAVPEWLLRLAAICATKKINVAEQCVDAPEFLAQIQEVKRELAGLPEDAPLTAWGRWFLNTSLERPIAPGFSITEAQAAELAKAASPRPEAAQ